jgi:hypothetical protein
MMFGGIVMAVLAFIFLVLLMFNFKHIKTAIQVLEAAAEFMIGNKRVILVPFTYFFLIVGSFLLWCQCLVMIISLNKTVSAQGSAADDAGYNP